VPEPAPAPPWHSQEHSAATNITAENSSLRISGVVHDVMYVTSLNSPRVDDRPALRESFRRALEAGWNGTETPLKLASQSANRLRDATR
jgi:hypothetical protein